MRCSHIFDTSLYLDSRETNYCEILFNNLRFFVLGDFIAIVR